MSTAQRAHPRRTNSGTTALHGATAADANAIAASRSLTPPANLRKAEREIWDETIEAMAPGFLTAADRRQLAAYARVTVMQEATFAKLSAKPVLATPPHGNIKLNPVYSTWAKAITTQINLARELGLTPLARRAYVGTTPERNDDDARLAQLSA